MICEKCSNEPMENQVLGKTFYYCRTCKIEVDHPVKTPKDLYAVKPEGITSGIALRYLDTQTITSITPAELQKMLYDNIKDIFRAMTSTGGLLKQNIVFNTNRCLDKRQGYIPVLRSTDEWNELSKQWMIYGTGYMKVILDES